MAWSIFIIRSLIHDDHDGARVDTPGASFVGPGPWLPLLRTLTTTATLTLTQHEHVHVNKTWKLNVQSSGDHALIRDDLPPGKVRSLCLRNRLNHSHPEAIRADQNLQSLNRIEPFTCQSPMTFPHPSSSCTWTKELKEGFISDYLFNVVLTLISHCRFHARGYEAVHYQIFHTHAEFCWVW